MRKLVNAATNDNICVCVSEIILKMNCAFVFTE